MPPLFFQHVLTPYTHGFRSRRGEACSSLKSHMRTALKSAHLQHLRHVMSAFTTRAPAACRRHSAYDTSTRKHTAYYICTRKPDFGLGSTPSIRTEKHEFGDIPRTILYPRKRGPPPGALGICHGKSAFGLEYWFQPRGICFCHRVPADHADTTSVLGHQETTKKPPGEHRRRPGPHSRRPRRRPGHH